MPMPDASRELRTERPQGSATHNPRPPGSGDPKKLKSPETQGSEACSFFERSKDWLGLELDEKARRKLQERLPMATTAV